MNLLMRTHQNLMQNRVTMTFGTWSLSLPLNGNRMRL